MLAPPEGTVERWAWDYITNSVLACKLAPPAVPARWEDSPPVRRLTRPGRPSELQLLQKSRKFPGPGALAHPLGRARIVHTFVHHEMQAAELMAWAILAFPAAPRPFRRGLLAICGEELRHMQLYTGYLRQHGSEFGAFPVRDWFWKRVPRAETPAQFVAVMGLGLEGGNLDHSDRFAHWFRAAGDAEAATILDTVRGDEIRHVRFAARWFRRFAGGLDFEAWRAQLPTPLSPTIMRGERLNRMDRSRAGLDEAFLEQLAQWQCSAPGS